MTEVDTWRAYIEELLARIDEGGAVAIPNLDGIAPTVFARWLYRAWLERSNAWGPFVSLHRRHDGERELTGWEYARGGLLHLDTPIKEAAPHEALTRAVERGDLTLLYTSGERARPPMSWRASVLQMDAYHDLASDPSLTRLRRSLISHCSSASPIHLSGEHGVGKARLAMWAHAALDDRPLTHLRGEHGRHVPGQWLLFEEVGELGDEQRGLLEELTRAQDLVLGSIPHPKYTRERPQLPALEPLIGKNTTFVELLYKILALAPRAISILLSGEPGVGKEVLARAIHEVSGRPGDFVAVDMGAVPASLFESELFGHKKGAFTDARQARQGAFVRAQGGTLFLDEIGNLSLDLQVKLLRALQERAVTPVGADRAVAIDCRIITATNADLDALVSRGRFRADLLGRLDAATLHVPPLRQRRDDIDRLARHFLSRHRDVPPDEPWCDFDALDILIEHTWPGNIRELANVIDYAAAITPTGELLSPDMLGPLSPNQRRPVPLLSTHSGETPLSQNFGLDSSTARALTSTTLSLPAVRERRREGRRHLILQGLAGRPITRGALHALEDYPWWGNLRELSSNLAVIETLPPGPLDLKLLNEYLPHLLGAAASAPIKILLSPSRTSRGSVEGLTWEVDAGALLIGRAGQFEQITRAADAGDPRSSEWLDFIREVIADGSAPTCLEIPFMRRLSRSHALVKQGRRGLEVYKMPGVRLEVRARPLDESEHENAEGNHGVEIGCAGEICFVHPRTQEVYLQLFAFSGELAYDEFAPLAVSAHQRLEQSADRTIADTTHHEPAPKEEDEERLYRWALEEPEVEMLVDICASFNGGMLGQHVALCLDTCRERDELDRLVTYLERAPRISQYITRLFTYEHNASLRELLAERASESSEPQWLALLPVGVRRSIEDL